MENQYTKTYTIQPQDCGENGMCRFVRLIGLMEDLVADHVQHLGVDGYFMHEKYNAGWMVLRRTVQVLSPIRAGDTVEITTWSRGLVGAGDYRDYRLCIDGREAALATEVWVLTDLDSRSLIMMRKVKELEQTHCPQAALNCKPRRLQEPEQAALCGTAVVQPDEIDINGHMNNVPYVAHALEYLQDFDGCAPYTVEMNYLHEVLQGEQMRYTRQWDADGQTVCAYSGGHLSFLMHVS
ncbi:MAG: acyl-[acyl-carrier-protein] thioesterase [Faecousia sp.]